MVIEESITYIYISMISEPFMAWGMILSGGLNGAGDTRGGDGPDCPERLAGADSPLFSPGGRAGIRGDFGMVVDERLPTRPGAAADPALFPAAVAAIGRGSPRVAPPAASSVPAVPCCVPFRHVPGGQIPNPGQGFPCAGNLAGASRCPGMGGPPFPVSSFGHEFKKRPY